MKKIVKRIAAMGAAVMMMASMSAIGVNAYGTASFSNELAHSDDYNPITTTSGYSIDYAYGVWATSISSVSGYSKGTPRFKVKTGGYSDYVDVYNTNQLYSFDSSMCRGNIFPGSATARRCSGGSTWFIQFRTSRSSFMSS